MISSTATVAETAIVAETANIADAVDIGPFAIVEAGAVVGAGCRIAAHAIIKTGAVLGADVHVDHHAVVAGLPQDLGFDSAVLSRVVIGAGTRLREGATVHRSTKPGGATVVGPGCYLMAYSHVAHDCELAEGVILANAAAVAGHVRVGRHVFISGGVMVHQFVRVGEGAMCSGNGRFGMDIPPFTNALERNQVAGLNLVGLRRRGFSRAVIVDLKNCYQAVYGSASGGGSGASGGGNGGGANGGSASGRGANLMRNAAAALAASLPQTEQGRQFLSFFTDAENHRQNQFIRPRPHGGE